MTGRLARIRRHPIKSVGGEDLDRVTLAPARRLPGDREWAILTQSGERHAGQGEPATWLPKSCFLRGVAAAPLQAVSDGWMDERRMRLTHPSLPDLIFEPETEGARLTDWIAPLWPEDKPAASRLVRGAGIWTDVKWPWVSILSLSTLSQLEESAGKSLGIERWRGNLWVEGWEPSAERDLIGHVIRLGTIELRVTEPIGRCEATSANTDTGTRDIDMLATLASTFGHTDFGIYAEVVTGGDIAIGDRIAA
ncbi:MOSC domain-containing protein [Paracoccus sp. TK19116]|uniref:MOSC domain-containing protein n=1 Tax=Paracoccus albicereus TaxID=2922394 RepID=A0ABT1MTQ4_9RHOB|nr:MOSC domain-containing protein [Paracoccus albicereus]MCQ0970713.1 MOSC domain-containing protein [Paracoccus albicereus]